MKKLRNILMLFEAVLGKLMRSFGFAVLVVSLVAGMFVTSGCGPAPAKTVLRSKAKVWERFSEMENGSFTVVDLTVVPLGAHKARVSGGILNCGYDVISGECRWEPKGKWITERLVREYGFYGYSPSYNRKYIIVGKERLTRNLSTQYTPWMPSAVVITNPFGKNITVMVGADGTFSTILYIEDKYFFTGSSLRAVRKSKYFDYYHYPQPREIRVTPASPPRGVEFDSRNADLFVNWLKVDMDMVEKYVDNYQSIVTLEFVDKISRVPVSPNITVTCLKMPSLSEIENIFAKEFGDRAIAKKAMKKLSLGQHIGFNVNKQLWDVKRGDIRKVSGQGICFMSVRGASYKVEAIHGKYYYFTGVLNIRRSPENKKVLLVERGGKVRNEDVREGEGGVIIDSY